MATTELYKTTITVYSTEDLTDRDLDYIAGQERRFHIDHSVFVDEVSCEEAEADDLSPEAREALGVEAREDDDALDGPEDTQEYDVFVRATGGLAPEHVAEVLRGEPADHFPGGEIDGIESVTVLDDGEILCKVWDTGGAEAKDWVEAVLGRAYVSAEVTFTEISAA